MDDETFASAEEEAVEKAHIAADIAPAVYEATDVWQRRGAEVLDPLVKHATRRFMDDLCFTLERQRPEMTVGELISAWHAYEESNPAPEPPSSNNPRGTMSFYEVVRAAGAEWDQREERKQKLWEAYRRGEIG